jgi:dTDP-4-amino-4,6-dideoxygalactose transaminase
MPVPFFRPSIGDDEISAVVECLKSGWLTTGPKTREFEEQFAAVIGGGVHALSVNSATAALHLGVDALGIGPGDEVIVPTLTFTATAEVVRYVGATPVFVDCDPSTLCIDAKAAEAAITERTRLIMPVHFAGRMCDMTALREIADRHGLKILDDAAHALPASHRGQSVGLTGADVTAFSFYANKTMTTGEGGMLVTRDAELAGRARIMRLHGIDRDVFNRFTDPRASWMYDVIAPGYKYNLTDIASAMGSVQLARHQDFAERRTALAARYDTALADLPLILPPHPAPGDTHSWHLYIAQIGSGSKVNRDELIAALRDRGIGTSVHYRPLHQMQFWSHYCKGHSFPAADAYFDRCVSLPLFMAMTDDEQDEVIEAVRSVICDG